MFEYSWLFKVWPDWSLPFLLIDHLRRTHQFVYARANLVVHFWVKLVAGDAIRTLQMVPVLHVVLLSALITLPRILWVCDPRWTLADSRNSHPWKWRWFTLRGCPSISPVAIATSVARFVRYLTIYAPPLRLHLGSPFFSLCFGTLGILQEAILWDIWVLTRRCDSSPLHKDWLKVMAGEITKALQTAFTLRIKLVFWRFTVPAHPQAHHIILTVRRWLCRPCPTRAILTILLLHPQARILNITPIFV